MKSVLEELYKGSIYPDEQIVPRGVQYSKLSKEITEYMKMWKERLPKSEFHELEELFDLKNDLNSLQTQESFVHGFKLGSLMMIEVYTNTEHLARK